MLGWVGNPGLDTEKHNKLEIILSGREGNWNWRPAVWVDQVDDYVLRSQDRYYNIDARLLGVEGQLGWSNGTWSTNSKLADRKSVVYGTSVECMRKRIF